MFRGHLAGAVRELPRWIGQDRAALKMPTGLLKILSDRQLCAHGVLVLFNWLANGFLGECVTVDGHSGDKTEGHGSLLENAQQQKKQDGTQGSPCNLVEYGRAEDMQIAE